jgi:hypothetical protein
VIKTYNGSHDWRKAENVIEEKKEEVCRQKIRNPAKYQIVIDIAGIVG